MGLMKQLVIVGVCAVVQPCLPSRMLKHIDVMFVKYSAEQNLSPRAGTVRWRVNKRGL